MPGFLRKVLVFGVVLLAYLGLMYAVNCMSATLNAPRAGETILIAGDSHVERALNPELLGSAESVAQNMEPYYVTYWKLKRMLAGSPVKTLILGLTHHQLSDFNDLKLSHQRWAPEMFRRIYVIEEAEAAARHGIKVDRSELWRAKFRNMCLYPKWTHDAFLGGYTSSSDSLSLDQEHSLKRHFQRDGETCGISTYSLACLESIVDLCTRLGIRIVFIAPPVHSLYFEGIPEVFIRRYEELTADLRARGLEVWDYTRLPMEDSGFLNSDHLNERGARQFSQLVATRLREPR